MATMNKIFAGYNARCEITSRSSSPFAQGVAWIQGTLVPLNEARIPLLDQGFLRSDLTYDVPAVWDGRFFRLDDHLDRLDASCKKLRLRLPLSPIRIKDVLINMVARSGIRDAFVQLIVTRGLKPVRDLKPNELQDNHLYMLIRPYIWIMQPSVQCTGGKAVIARTVRRTPPGAMDPTVKNLQWGDFTRGTLEALDRGAVYPFLTDGDANITEGAGYNIVLIKDDVLYTPDHGVLEGVTRKSVFDVARVLGKDVKVQRVPVELAYEADEIFMCTTAGGIMPITYLDGQAVKDGKVGPLTQEIWDGYWEMHYNPKYSAEIGYAGVNEKPLAKL